MAAEFFHKIREFGFGVDSCEVLETGGVKYVLAGGAAVYVDNFLFIEQGLKTKLFSFSQIEKAVDWLIAGELLN